MELEDPRLKTLFIKSQQTFILRVTWACLVYNFIVCFQLVSSIGLDFFSLFNVLILCTTNGTTIVITLIAYKKLRWLHALGPLIMVT